MDLEKASISSGSGIIGALLSFLVLSRRLDEQKQRIDNLEKAVLFKDTCEVCKKSGDDTHKELRESLKSIEEKQDRSDEKLNQILGRLAGTGA